MTIARLAFALLLAMALACDDPEPETGRTGPPNIVLIVLDDLDYEDLGSDDVQTPHLDRLAADGMRFTQYYASSPVCSPTRAALLTGVEPARLGFRYIVKRSSRRGIPRRIPTLAALLRDADYATAHVGKWHLGTQRREFLPIEKGFQYTVRRRPVDEGEKSLYTRYEIVYDEASTRRVDGTRHLTEGLTDEAIRLLGELHPPFFLNLWYWAPHTPLALPENYDNSLTRYDLTSRRGRYAAMVSNVDRQIGRVLARLDERGLRDNTLVLVTSDNGGARHMRSDRAQRGGKSTLYEGGIRVPLIARWPDRIAGGAINSSLLAAHDVLPTLAELAEHPLLGEAADRSFASALLEGREIDRTGPLFFEAKRDRSYFDEPLGRYVSYAVRDDRWKLVFGSDIAPGARPQLFDVVADPGEAEDLAVRHPEERARLDRAYHSWRLEAGNQPLVAVAGPDGTTTLGPDPALDIHDGDFSFAFELGPFVDGTSDEPLRVVDRPGSWRITLEEGRIVLSLFGEAGDRLTLRGGLIDRSRSHQVAFTIFAWKKSPSTVRLFLDGRLEAEATQGLGPIQSNDEPIVLGADARLPLVSLLCIEPDQVSAWQRQPRDP